MIGTPTSRQQKVEAAAHVTPMTPVRVVGGFATCEAERADRDVQGHGGEEEGFRGAEHQVDVADAVREGSVTTGVEEGGGECGRGHGGGREAGDVGRTGFLPGHSLLRGSDARHQ